MTGIPYYLAMLSILLIDWAITAAYAGLTGHTSVIADAAGASALILGVINRCSLLGMRYKRSADSPWDAARLFSPGELTCLVKEAAGTLSLEIHWRTTLFPILAHDLPLPWGGFIGLRARIPPEVTSKISPETAWKP